LFHFELAIEVGVDGGLKFVSLCEAGVSLRASKRRDTGYVENITVLSARGAVLKFQAGGGSDAGEEAAGVEGVGGVELLFDRAHKGKGIAGSAPSVERGKRGGAMDEDERAAHFFEVGAQAEEGAVQVIVETIEAEPAETGSADEGFPAKAMGIGGVADELDGVSEVGGEDGDFGDGGFGWMGERPKVLAGVPDSRRGLGDFFREAEGTKMRALRVEAGFGAFEQNVDRRNRFSREARLKRDVGELGILNGEQPVLRFFRSGRGKG